MANFYDDRKSLIADGHSKSIEMIQRSGSDFLKNKFDVFLVVYSQDVNHNLFEVFDKDARFLSNYADKKIFADMAQFMVRTGDVEIPQMESETYEIKFLYNSIKKVRSKVKFERKASLKIRMDEPLFFNAFFNILSNNNNITGKLGVEPQIFAPFTTNRIFKEDLKNKLVRIDLFVKHQSFMRMGTSDIKSPNIELNEQLKSMVMDRPQDALAAGMMGMQPEDLPFWFFEDVNFLGQADPITFDRDSANIIDMTYPFLFKRLVLISPQERGSSGRPIDTINPKNMMDTSGQTRAVDDQNWYYNSGM